MMQVRVVRVRMHKPAVLMPMGMRLSAIPRRIVLVAVMLVVGVRVLVKHGLMEMRVLVTLADMKPDADPHESRSDPERKSRAFIEEDQRDGDAGNRRG